MERERKDVRGKDTKTFLSRGMLVTFLTTWHKLDPLGRGNLS